MTTWTDLPVFLVLCDDECVVMAVNPWQLENDEMSMRFSCEGFEGEVTMRGKTVTLLRVSREQKIVEI